jgi:hypothetical protein
MATEYRNVPMESFDPSWKVGGKFFAFVDSDRPDRIIAPADLLAPALHFLRPSGIFAIFGLLALLFYLAEKSGIKSFCRFQIPDDGDRQAYAGQDSEFRPQV